MRNQNIIVLLFFISLVFFSYKNCLSIFIPGDNYSFLYLFEKEGAAAIMTHAQDGSPYFVAFSLLYLLYQLFGVTPAFWIITVIAFHALNAFLIFLIAKRLLRTFLPDTEILAAFFPALLFLISPYQTENVLWVNMAFGWHFHACVTLAGIQFFIQHLINPSRKKIILIHFLFLLGIFSYEFTFICPLIYTVVWMLFRILEFSRLRNKEFLLWIILPQVIFILAYFSVCKQFSGHWFWHAGTFEDITQTSDYSKTLLKYFAKFFLLYRYLPQGHFDDILRTFSSNQWVTAISCLCILSAFAFLFWRLIKIRKKYGYILTALFLCFIISLLPVLPLDSSFTKYIYPDRYGYLPSVFFYLFFSSFVFFLFRKIAVPVLVGYAVLCWILLMKTIPVWNSTNDYCNRLIQSYKPFLRYDNVFVLNVPTYYKGIIAFRSAFAESIYMKLDNSFSVEKIKVVSGSYQESDEDSLLSVSKNGNSVMVRGVNKKTPYFSTNGGWAKSYETDEYKVEFDSTRCSYLLTFKKKIPQNSAFIYVSKGYWKKIE